MRLIEELFQGKGYIDGITIINLDGEILFTAKFNEKLNPDVMQDDTVGKNFFEIYQNLNPGTSTTIKAMECGVPVYVEDQLLKIKGKESIRIASLSIPIKRGERTVGAIDLSLQETESDAAPDVVPVQLSTSDFSKDNTKKLFNQDTAHFTIDDIIANEKKMRQLKSYVPVVANCSLPVLIYGETGTGKEVFAQAIHNSSPRRNMPFVAQNCAALPETLLESILFGTAKGAFTGAAENKGLFELADGGTLFLDEINSMPILLQSKLLRVLQDGCFRALGSRYVKSVDVKVIAAINVDPLLAIEKGQLRQDIYYRLSMMSINIPPLRERKGDIHSFIKLYVNKHNATFQKQIRYISKNLIAAMESYDWPGNLRELEHIIVYGMSRVDSMETVLKLKDIQDKFPQLLRKQTEAAQQPVCMLRQTDLPVGPCSLRQIMQEIERSLISEALEATGGNVAKAARRLQIPRQTLNRKIQQLEIKI